MFDTLVYIPAILAYSFVSLLLVILAFVVIYVSHKIYATIYDNLPVAEIPTSTIKQQLKKAIVVGGITNGQVMGARKSKTAMRIIVTLEPCYMAFILFRSNWKTSKNISTVNLTLSNPNLMVTNNLLIKYYDNLEMIPTSNSQIDEHAESVPPSMLISHIPVQ